MANQETSQVEAKRLSAEEAHEHGNIMSLHALESHIAALEQEIAELSDIITGYESLSGNSRLCAAPDPDCEVPVDAKHPCKWCLLAAAYAEKEARND